MPRKVSEIKRHAVFAWSPIAQADGAPVQGPFIVTGTTIGPPCLEIYKLTQSTEAAGKSLVPLHEVSTDANFKALAWGKPTVDKPLGTIGGILEDNSIRLWDPAAILQNKKGATEGKKLDEVDNLSALDFNKSDHVPEEKVGKVEYSWDLAASAGNVIYTWNLSSEKKDKFEIANWKDTHNITSVSWNNGARQILAITAKEKEGATSKKEDVGIYNVEFKKMIPLQQKAVSVCRWSPTNDSQLVTAFSTDITLWNLPKYREGPFKTLKGHTSDVVDLSWCDHDADLLLSCDKDGKTILWHLQDGDNLVGTVFEGDGQAMQTSWCPTNPNFMASVIVSETDKENSTISVYSPFQGSSQSVSENDTRAKVHNEDDWFQAMDEKSSADGPPLIMKTPPKWLSAPAGASFGFGGKLVTFNSTKGWGITTLDSDTDAAKPFEDLLVAPVQQDITELISQRLLSSSQQDKEDWEVLQALSSDNPNDQLMSYLGYAAPPQASEETSGVDAIPSELNQSASLDAGATEEVDFFTQMIAEPAATAPKTSNARADEAASELVISGGDDASQRITKAVILGDFESAVKECVSANRLADALILATHGGPDLLSRTQKLYFEQQTEKTAYIRLLEGLVQEDLRSVVQQASLADWKSLLVFLFKNDTKGEFSDLAVELGTRLASAKNGHDYRRHATTCFLAARNLEKATQIWTEEQTQSPDYLGSLYSLMEKIVIFNHVISKDSGYAKQHLETVYEKYTECANVLANQGNMAAAHEYAKLVPVQHTGADERLDIIRAYIPQPSGPPPPAKQNPPTFTGGYAPSQYQQPQYQQPQYQQPQYQQPQYQQPQYQQPQYQTPQYTNANGQYQSMSSGVAPPAGNLYPAPSAPLSRYGQPTTTAYEPTSAYGQPQQLAQPYSPSSSYAAPQPSTQIPQDTALTQSGPPPPAKGAWNDVPDALASRKSTRSPSNTKPSPQNRITSPFVSNQTPVSSHGPPVGPPVGLPVGPYGPPPSQYGPPPSVASPRMTGSQPFPPAGLPPAPAGNQLPFAPPPPQNAMPPQARNAPPPPPQSGRPPQPMNRYR